MWVRFMLQVIFMVAMINIELLKLINFNDEDTLYIIGDIIDRGTQNVAMLKM